MNLLSKVALATILFFYVLFGLKHSSQQGFWHDEIYSLTFLKGVSVYDFEGSIWTELDTIFDAKQIKALLAEDHFNSNFSIQILHEGHPPLYFILLKFWSYVFGSSELALRSFSLCCGVLIFLILFNLFRDKAKRKYTAWVILAMLIFNPFLFYFFTEARMYALALLFATLTFKYWIYYREKREIKSSSFIYFCIASVGLLYTHYYGLFFLSSLAFFELVNFGVKRSIFNHSIAIFLFLPWGFAIREQLRFHDVHWTDGIISFGESVMGYFNGLINLLISPMSDPVIHEKVIIISIILLAIGLLFAKQTRFILILLSTIFIYGLQIYVFDQIVGHHSILVPRYYLFVLVFVYWGLFKAIDSSYKLPTVLFAITYVLFAGMVLKQLYKLDRAPKQMFREVAGFIDNHLDSKNSILVFEPKGPLVIGVAYYLQNNFKLITADLAPKDLGVNAVYIDEMLGVEFCENKLHRKQQEKLDLTPFVGVFLYK
jgi:uncharacterized membrane protein